ncbi:3'-5' exonuclease [Handroanthus impetiginosus]|uniref:RNA exonuclease 4 n=1 Tax=Handroanthus impetiginosus TaxID=429701 RepID=A0A2G9HKY3_9LAMI|nr:3'-5' exonuclease [Handroanthus impetiginosus]
MFGMLLAMLTCHSGSRHKCAACFKQYKKKEHLIAHMKASYHSVHQPKCSVCQKHCKSFESLREHTTGPLAKGNCSKIFAERGCNLCMRIFDSPDFLTEHRQICCLQPPVPLEMLDTESLIYDPPENVENSGGSHIEAIAIDCEMVGGGSDGSLDLCARVCLVDEDEKPIFHTYVQPQIPITNYRYEVTGITEDHLKDAMPLDEVQEKILQILYNGESIGRLRLNGGKARVLLGHGLEHDLDCLRMNYPDHLLRDTAKYPPLMKTNLVSHSLKYLVKTYLGYDIQSGMHNPYEDCVAVMRLYKRLRAQKHQTRVVDLSLAAWTTPSLMNGHDSWNYRGLENMTPDELFDTSKSNYRCWCLDSPHL